MCEMAFALKEVAFTDGHTSEFKLQHLVKVGIGFKSMVTAGALRLQEGLGDFSKASLTGTTPFSRPLMSVPSLTCGLEAGIYSVDMWAQVMRSTPMTSERSSAGRCGVFVGQSES